MKGLRIGITVDAAAVDAHAVLWSSGINQNIAYLAMLMQRLPCVAQCWLVGCPNRPFEHPFTRLYGLPGLTLAEAAETLDVLIELGARAEAQHLLRLRDRGGRLVSYMAGNSMVMNFESLASVASHGEFLSEVMFDACWITPQHWRTNRAYAEITRAPQVRQAPQVWIPLCLNQSAGEARNTGYFWREPDHLADEGWRIGVFDPNINVVKTLHLPTLVCEEAHRRAPGLIGHVYLFSAEHLKNVPHVAEFVTALDLGKAGKITAESRFPIAQMLGVRVDAVVTHQWENDLNYLYWDVLYAGRPLIHNAAPLRDVGAYYASFDPQDGGRVMADALKAHPGRPQAARRREMEFLWQFHVDNPALQETHRELLEAVMDAPRC